MHNVLFSSIVVAWLSACGATNVCAAEPVTAGRVLGQVAGADGAPVSGAVVYLSGHGAGRQTTTDARGRFVLTDVATGTYELAVDARGYNHLGERAVDVRARESPLLSLVLERASATLVTIGRVRNPDAQTISTSAVPSVVLDTQRFGAQGYANVADIIAQNSISTTVIRPNGAGAGAPAVVALRGPDPTETLVQIDGHSVTSGHTGSYDLSLLDPADLSSVQLVYGIAPTSLVGPNTIDGAVNVRTLGPTTQPHGLLRVSGGSFGTFGETLQATGTASSIGYAFSLHRATSQGEVRDTNLTAADGSATTVNGALAATTALGKLHYDFDRGAGFVELAFHDQSASRDLSAALTSLSSDGYAPSPGSSLSAHDAAYTVDLRAPLGVPRADGVAQTSVLYSHGSSLANQSVFGPAAGSSPYLFSDVDRLGDDAVQLDTIVGRGTLSAKFELRTEALLTPQSAFAHIVDQSVRRRLLAAGNPGSPAPNDGQTSALLTQTQRSFVLRYAGESSAQLHYSLAAYYSDFSSFGTSIDPRASVVWTPTARSAVRASVGTTFQAPQLTELYVPPVLPLPNSDGYISVGNPNLRADRATGFDFGFEQRLGRSGSTHAGIDLYRTNLRTPAQRYLPSATCTAGSDDAAACLTYPVNVGGAVYRGIELQLDRALGRTTVVRAAYGINSSYATSVSPEFQNGTIVRGEQSPGVPLHKALLSLEKRGSSGLSYEAGLVYEDGNNELNRPAFATVHAGVSFAVHAVEANLLVSNLTNVYADRFTHLGAGDPYGGQLGPIPTDAYALPGRAVNFAITHRF